MKRLTFYSRGELYPTLQFEQFLLIQGSALLIRTQISYAMSDTSDRLMMLQSKTLEKEEQEREEEIGDRAD